MQLLIVTDPYNGFDTGDIVAVVPDTHVWGSSEVMALWLGNGNAAADFPSPAFAVMQMPSEPPDLNLMEPRIEADPAEPEATVEVAKRAWYVDLQALPRGVTRSLEQPGGQASVGRNRRSAIKHRATGVSLPLRSESDGNTRHRHPATNERSRVDGQGGG